MDPDTTLAELREALAAGDYQTVAERADALDRWLSSGGFLPADWSPLNALTHGVR